MNADFRSFIDVVRSRCDLVQIIGADVDLRPAGSTLKGLSPFHSEKDPSFVVWPDTQTWRDFSNGGALGGDVFAYVQERDRVSFKEALLLLAERAGVRSPHQDEASFQRSLVAVAERREVQRLLTAAANYYHSVLPVSVREQLLQTHYGFADATIDQLKLGWADGNLLRHFRDALGVTGELALKTGLFVLVGGTIKDFFNRRLVFPYWRGGQAVYFIARQTEETPKEDWEQAKYKKLLTHSERHPYVSTLVANDHFYNEDAARGADELLITEGVTDCISAMQAGVACISPVTTRFRRQDTPKLLKLAHQAKRVIICNDSEVNGAGEAGARETAAALWADGCDVRLAVIPRPAGQDKIDVNELVAKQGPDRLREVLRQARSYPDFLLDAIPANTSPEELDAQLEPVLQSLSGCSGIKADAVLDAIQEKFGLRRRVLLAKQREVRSVITQPMSGPETDAAGKSARPQVRLSDRQLREIVFEAAEIVVHANAGRIAAAAAPEWSGQEPPLFLLGGRMARLERAMDDQSPVLTLLGETMAYGVLLRDADWTEQVDGRHQGAPPPKDVAKDFIVNPPPLPKVETILSTPVFAADGRLLTTAGLHERERLWMHPDPTLQLTPVPASPSAAEVAAALSLFRDDLFVNFDFVEPSDRAHALAMVLVPFARRLVNGLTPLHVVDAPAVGSGKGLLCNLVSVVVTGHVCDTQTVSTSEEEIRKMLTAELIRARPLILLDNIAEGEPLRSAALASILTASSWTDRILGKSTKVTMSNHAVWMLTGNNVQLSRDLARRSIQIRIDPGHPAPWRRTNFKHKDIVSWAKEHRGRLVQAALTLVQAWLAAGRPMSSMRLGSYENWAAVMGGILETIGVEGFLGNLDKLYASADVDGAAWRKFAQAWWDEFGEQEVFVSSLETLCDRNELLEAIRGEGNLRSRQSRLGRALRSARDRVFDEFRLNVCDADRKGRTPYALAHTRPAHEAFAPTKTNGLSA